MSDAALHGAGSALAEFRHEAFLYAGATAFLEGTVPFIQDGLAGGEPVLVVVGATRIDQLRHALGTDASRVSFADMAGVGRNPARIIPAWRDFLAAHAGGRPARGIGEPVHAERTADELVECQRHEALLNVAFAGGSAWRLLCPYDTTALPGDVIEDACHSHRYVTDGRSPEESTAYQGDMWAGPGGAGLPEPPGDALPLAFGPGPLHGVRRFVVDHVGDTLGAGELSDLLVSVTEAAGNSIVHGGGAGTVRVWSTATAWSAT